MCQLPELASGSISVPAGGDLQRALNTALPGETILLEPGATFVGHFVLPARTTRDLRPTIVRTGGPDVVPEGQRITPGDAAKLAKIRSPDQEPALRTAAKAAGWRVELVEFAPSGDGGGDIIALGDGSTAQSSAASVPSDLAFDRVYIHGDPQRPQKRGIALNSARTTITNSYIADIKAAGQDSQAIAAWNGPGDYTIENNYLEAAGENVLIGGADPSILGLTPAHIVVRRNVMSKPLAWRDERTPWTVKNLFELKNARDVVVEQNLFERNWFASQTGFAVLFTVRNQDGGCGWCQVENVQFRSNVIRDVAAGISILGFDDTAPSRQTNNIVIRGNLFEGVDRKWGGNSFFLQMLNNPRDITLDHNTILLGDSNGLALVEDRVTGFAFTNNLAMLGDYGFAASGRGIGNDAIRAALPGAKFTANVLAGATSGSYPPGNFVLTPQEFRAQFVDFVARDFRLKPGGRWTRAADDGTSVGAALSDAGVPLPAKAFPRR